MPALCKVAEGGRTVVNDSPGDCQSREVTEPQWDGGAACRLGGVVLKWKLSSKLKFLRINIKILILKVVCFSFYLWILNNKIRNSKIQNK